MIIKPRIPGTTERRAMAAKKDFMVDTKGFLSKNECASERQASFKYSTV